MRNKRALDRAERRAHEAAGTTGELVARPLKSRRTEDEAADEANGSPQMAAEENLAVEKKKAKKSDRSAATGMQLKAPKSKANGVERPDFGGFGEPGQAGFGHVPSGTTGDRLTARDISRAAAKDPAVMAQMRGALATAAETAADAKPKAKSPEPPPANP